MVANAAGRREGAQWRAIARTISKRGLVGCGLCYEVGISWVRQDSGQPNVEHRRMLNRLNYHLNGDLYVGSDDGCLCIKDPHCKHVQLRVLACLFLALDAEDSPYG